MKAPSVTARVGRFVLLHEQALKLLYAGMALALVALIVADRQGFHAVDAWLAGRETRWVQQLEAGEKLVADGKFDEATEFLSKLDEEFPARHIKHALGREKERLLVALGKAWDGAGRQKRARETFDRLVALDPKNFANHYERAQVLLRQGRTKLSLADEGFAALGRCLAINPSFAPAVALLRISNGYTLYRFRDCVNWFREYQEAFLMPEVDFEFDGAVVEHHVIADGRYHEVELRPTAGSAKAIRMRCATHAVEFGPGRAFAAQTVGQAPAGELSREISPAAWTNEEIKSPRANTYGPAGDKLWLTLDPAAVGAGVARVTLRLRVLRPVAQGTVDRVVNSLKNLKDADLMGIDFDRLILGSMK